MKTDYTQLFCRLALGVGFLSAVMDRFGLLGAFGEPHISWGNWGNFYNYTADLLFYFPPSVINLFAIVATVAETIFGLTLILGLFTKLSSILSGILLLSFAIAMTFSAGLHSALSYSVYSAAAAAFLLSHVPVYRWSSDFYLMKINNNN